MQVRHLVVAALLAALAACGPQAPSGGAEVFRISAREAREIPLRMEESINSLRSARGVAPVQLNAQLTAAAESHSRDMANQNRPWHWGSDGSSPYDRVARAGYAGQFQGEAISETFETDGETLSYWMSSPVERQVILDPLARNIGVGWYQENSGKIWWTLVTGT